MTIEELNASLNYCSESKKNPAEIIKSFLSKINVGSLNVSEEKKEEFIEASNNTNLFIKGNVEETQIFQEMNKDQSQRTL